MSDLHTVRDESGRGPVLTPGGIETLARGDRIWQICTSAPSLGVHNAHPTRGFLEPVDPACVAFPVFFLLFVAGG